MQSMLIQFIVLVSAVMAMWTVTAAPVAQVAEKQTDGTDNDIKAKVQKPAANLPTKIDSSEIVRAAQANVSNAVQAPAVPAQAAATSVSVAAAGLSPQSSQMSEENGGQEMDDQQYLEALLSDPRLMREMRQQEREQEQLEELEQERELEKMYPSRLQSTNFVLTPLAMAEYLLVSGDLAGVVKIVRDLVADGSLTVEEAKSYEAAIQAEYAILTERDDDNSDYIQQNKRYSDEILQSVDAIPDYGSNFDYQGFAQTPEELSAGSDNKGAWEQEQMNPNYEEMLQNLLDTIELEQQNGNSVEQDIQTSLPTELEALNPDSRYSIEEELESLPAHEKTKSASNSEMSIEDELALLSKASPVQENKPESHTDSDQSRADVLQADNVHKEKQQQMNNQINQLKSTNHKSV